MFNKKNQKFDIQKIVKNINFRVLYTLLSALVIIAGSYLAIQYAKGSYRVTQNGFRQMTGLLNANSFPNGAEVYIDGKLVTATDDTIYLEPGEYQVEIIKDGFSSWKKTLTIENELVTQTNAQLFPSAPSLVPLTFTGVSRISPSPNGQKLIYYTNEASSKARNGIYIIDLSNNLISLQRGPRHLLEDDSNLNFMEASFIWSPDSSQVMILGKNKEVLISTEKKNELKSLTDISWKKKQILSEWEEEIYLGERQFLKEFPEEIINIATTSAKNVYFSPDKKRLLFTALEETSIPNTIIPPMPASNNQQEERMLKSGSIYVYDREEDKNFLIGFESGDESNNSKSLLSVDLYLEKAMSLDASPSAFQRLQATSSAQTAMRFNSYHSSLFINTLQWFPDSKHLIFTKEDKIHVMGYDGTNETTLYSGPFDSKFIYPWPDGSRLIILTSFSPDSPLNLYAIELK
jgi:hypothetical protein